MGEVVINKCSAENAGEVLGMIKELCIYEEFDPKDVITLTQQELRRLIEEGTAICYLIHVGNALGGYAVLYRSLDGVSGQPLFFLEDLYVRPQFRRAGVGGKMFDSIIQLSRSEGYKRIRWNALKWNTPAISFYTKLGAHDVTEKCGHVVRVAGREGLEKLRNFELNSNLEISDAASERAAFCKDLLVRSKEGNQRPVATYFYAMSTWAGKVMFVRYLADQTSDLKSILAAVVKRLAQICLSENLPRLTLDVPYGAVYDTLLELGFQDMTLLEEWQTYQFNVE